MYDKNQVDEIKGNNKKNPYYQVMGTQPFAPVNKATDEFDSIQDPALRSILMQIRGNKEQQMAQLAASDMPINSFPSMAAAGHDLQYGQPGYDQQQAINMQYGVKPPNKVDSLAAILGNYNSNLAAAGYAQQQQAPDNSALTAMLGAQDVFGSGAPYPGFKQNQLQPGLFQASPFYTSPIVSAAQMQNMGNPQEDTRPQQLATAMGLIQQNPAAQSGLSAQLSGVPQQGTSVQAASNALPTDPLSKLSMLKELMSIPNLPEGAKAQLSNAIQDQLVQLTGQSKYAQGQVNPNNALDPFSPISQSAQDANAAINKMKQSDILTQKMQAVDPNILFGGAKAVADNKPLTADNITKVKMPDGTIVTTSYDKAVASGLPIVSGNVAPTKDQQSALQDSQTQAVLGAKAKSLLDEMANQRQIWNQGLTGGSGMLSGAQSVLSEIGGTFSNQSNKIQAAGEYIDSNAGKLLNLVKDPNARLTKEAIEVFKAALPTTKMDAITFDKSMKDLNNLVGTLINKPKFEQEYYNQNGTYDGVDAAFSQYIINQAQVDKPAEQVFKKGDSSYTIQQAKDEYKKETGKDMTDDQAKYMLTNSGYQ